MSMGDHTPLKSSNLTSAAYDPEAQILEVTFKSGGTYQYRGVPKDVHAQLVGAGSPGAYVATRIRGVYPHSRIA